LNLGGFNIILDSVTAPELQNYRELKDIYFYILTQINGIDQILGPL